MKKRLCQRNGCTVPAVGITLLTLYPLPAMMRYYGNNDPITTIAIDIATCPEHKPTADDFKGGGIDPVIRRIEQDTGTTVDMSSIVIEVIPLDHPFAKEISGRRE